MEKKNLQDIIVVQMYERFKCIFNQITRNFGFFYFDKLVDLGKIFKNEIYIFSFGQNMKIIIKLSKFDTFVWDKG
jgi:hypothetical protein